MNEVYDVVVVGSGVAGLYCTINIPRHLKVLLITKECLEDSNSYLAQGGMSVLRDETDFDTYIQDTLKAGKYQNNLQAVLCMVQESIKIPEELIALGVEFDQKDGKLLYTKEAAHRMNRILHHKDITGQEIMNKLIQSVKSLSNVTIEEHCKMVDLVIEQDKCQGIIVEQTLQGEVAHRCIGSKRVVLATGGIGGLFANSTNYRHITGDGIALALTHGIKTKDLNYIQIHPTALYTDKEERRFLISEAVRGEGALLLNHQGKRFVDELLPRDVVSMAVQEEILKSDKPYVYLSLVHMGSRRVKERFPNIYKRCLAEGFDMTKEPIPVAPAQHYFMGGIEIDLEGRTSIEGLYAVGETGCNGVHGANRLASNSLLESVIFAKRAANTLSEGIEMATVEIKTSVVEGYDCQSQQADRELIFNEIKGKDGAFYDRWCNHAG